MSKTFQILYRNEEVVHDNLVLNYKLITSDDQVLLDDVIQYRVHILLDSARWSLIMIITEFPFWMLIFGKAPFREFLQYYQL